MKKFYWVALAGMIIFAIGCGQKPSDMSSSEQIMGNEEIIISDEDDTVSEDSLTSSKADELLLTPQTSADVTSSMIEKPTDEQIQQALQNAGLYQGSIDGKLGPKSKRAIREFQEQNGLTVDGKVGKKTWAKLGSYLNAAPATTLPTEAVNE